MRIMELCLSPSLGGLELYVFRTSVALIKQDDVVAVLNPHGGLLRYFTEKGLPCYEMESGFKALPLIKAKLLASIVDKEAIDVIHAHWTKDLPLAVLAKNMSRRKPRLVYTRQMQITRSKKDFYHNFIYRNIDLILAITRRLEGDLKKYLCPCNRDKVKTLYYGVREPEDIISDDIKRNLKAEVGVPESEFLVGIFGRIKHEKGQYLVIRAVKKLRSEGLSVSALIVGHPMDEPYLAELKDNAMSDHLDRHVIFKDFVDNPQLWMQVCDAVVLASENETFGLVLAEAMLAGVAVIGTNSGGVTEIIKNQETGLMFEPGDSDGLASCIRMLATDSEFKKNIAENGREKARGAFDHAEHYEKLRSLMATRGINKES